jgi:hypothetical protein
MGQRLAPLLFALQNQGKGQKFSQALLNQRARLSMSAGTGNKN